MLIIESFLSLDFDLINFVFEFFTILSINFLLIDFGQAMNSNMLNHLNSLFHTRFYDSDPFIKPLHFPHLFPKELINPGMVPPQQLLPPQRTYLTFHIIQLVQNRRSLLL